MFGGRVNPAALELTITEPLCAPKERVVSKPIMTVLALHMACGVS